MKPAICIPLIASTIQEAKESIKKSLEFGQLFELYLDYIEEISKENILELLNEDFERAICTFRRPKFEERVKTDEAIKEIVSLLPGGYADFDVFRECHFCAFTDEKCPNVRLITSYHNYDRTPSLQELKDVVDEMSRFDPAVFKIACNCVTPGDAITLMTLLKDLLAESKKAVVTGMGDHGIGVRVLGGMWGSEWVYAPFDENHATAPGQISVHKLNELYSILTP